MDSLACGCPIARGVDGFKHGFLRRGLRAQIGPTRLRRMDRSSCQARVGFCSTGPTGKIAVQKLKLPSLVSCSAAAAAAAGAIPSGGEEPILLSLQKQVLKFSQLWRSFLPMCSLFFFMAFINTIVNSLSLTLVITSGGGGAEVIPFLTVYAAFPASVLFMVLYAWASQHMNRKKLFNTIVTVFAAFNLVFALCLYPNCEVLHLSGLGEALAKVLPSGLLGAVGMIQNWTFTLFYCMSELWGDVGLSLLFWGFANEITKLEDAPILYPLFGIGANIAQMLGGLALRVLSSSQDSFTQSLQQLILLVVGCKVLVLLLHHRIESKSRTQREQPSVSGLGDGGAWDKVDAEVEERLRERERLEWMLEDDRSQYPSHYNRASFGRRYYHGISHIGNGAPGRDENDLYHNLRQGRSNGHGPSLNVPKVHERNGAVGNGKIEDSSKKDKSPSLMDALRTLSKSPAIRALGIMTMAQSLAVNLMEFLWKSHLRIAYPTPAAFAGFLGDVSTATGLVTGLLMFLSPVLFDRMGWRDVASVTPKILTFGGVAFFGACLAYHTMVQVGMGTTSQMLLPWTVIGGAILYVVARGAKFSLFKPAEEMVYIKLDKESQTKGKAAIDVVGAQMGKSGGSLLQQALLVASGGKLLGITPIIFGVYVVMLVGWQRAVNDLASQQQEPASPVVESNVSQAPSPVLVGKGVSHPDNDNHNEGPSLIKIPATAG